jgi:hypothetical protein
MTDGGTRGRLMRAAQVVEAPFGADERALLHLETSRYHVLNAVGTRIWELLATPTDIDTLCATLAGEYDISPQACRQDVQVYLDRLLAEHLVVRAP